MAAVLRHRDRFCLGLIAPPRRTGQPIFVFSLLMKLSKLSKIVYNTIMDLNKVLIIFNPASGKRYPADYRQKFINQLKWHLPDASSDWLETTPNLMAQLKTVNFKNYQRLIVIGGDGTVTTVADFLLNNKIDLPLAIIPQGSANVLASSLDIPLADKRAIKTAALGKEKKIDVGLLKKKNRKSGV